MWPLDGLGRLLLLEDVAPADSVTADVIVDAVLDRMQWRSKVDRSIGTRERN